MQAQEAALPPPESDGTAPMAPAQSAAIYGTSANAPKQTSGQSEARAQAKQKAAEREKRRVDALNSDTVAVNFQTHEAKGEGQSPSVAGPSVTVSVLSTCVTKQTKDMRYSTLEP